MSTYAPVKALTLACDNDVYLRPCQGPDTCLQCCGSGMFIPDPVSDFFPSRIPDPNCLHPGSRIRIKEIKYFNPKKPKKWFLSSRKYDPGCSSRIPDPDADFLPIPDPGVKKAPDPRSGSATLLACDNDVNVPVKGPDTFL
jgi:hypothetical protein